MVKYFLTPPQSGTVLIIMLTLFLPPLMIVLGLLTQVKQRGQRIGTKIGLGLLLLFIPLLLYLTVLAPRQTHVAVSDGVIRVNPAPAAAFDVTGDRIVAAYIADWMETGEVAPVKRTAGSTSGSYRTGNFRIRNGSPAILVARGTRVLVLELDDRYVLLAPDDFELFVSDFNERVAQVVPTPAEIGPVTGKPMSPRMPLVFNLFMGFIGALTFVLGYLTRFNKKVFYALYPYDISKLQDMERNARYVGNFSMITGIAIIILQFFPPAYSLLILVVVLPGTIYGLCKNIVFFPF